MEVKEVTNHEEELRVLDNLQATVEEAPAGYLRMELSTKGQLGAPAVFHIRSFDTKEIMELSITADSELPLKLSSILNKLIFEEDVNVADFHENEVIELLVKLFALFYDRKLELDFPIEEEDYQYLKNIRKEQLIQEIKMGNYKPKALIDLGKLQFYEVKGELKKEVEIRSKKTGFYTKFTYPKFGDAIIIKKFLRTAYKEKDKQMSNILQKLEIRQMMLQKEDGDIDYNKLPYISPEELEKYTAYETEKALFAVDLVRAMHLIDFNGEDLRDAPLSEKVKYISDPRINHKITQIIEKEFQKVEFGINPNIEVINPITKKPCTRRFLFRPLDILQAFKDFDSDEYDVRYD